MTTKKNNSTKKHTHVNKLSRKARKPKAHIHMEPNLAARQQKQNLICRMMQSYPPRVLDRRLQEAWARATKEGPRVLMNLRVDF